MSASSITYRPPTPGSGSMPRPQAVLMPQPVIAGDEASDGAGLRTLLNRLGYHWPTILFVGLLLAAPAALAVWYIMPPKFYTYSLLQVSPAPLSTGLGEDAPLDRNTFVTYLKTQAQLIKSNFVLTAALRDPKVANVETLQRQPDPIRWLEEELRVESHPDSELLKSTLEGDRAEDLAVIVNAVQSAYLREIVTEETRRKQDKLIMLEEFRQKLEDTNRTKQKALAEMTGSTGDASAASRERFQHTQYTLVMQDLNRVRQARGEAQMRLEKARARLKLVDQTELLADGLADVLSKDADYADMQARLETARRRVEYFARVANDPKRPEYQALRGFVERLETDMAAHVERVRTEVIEKQRARLKTELQSAFDLLTEEEASLAEKERQFQQHADTLQGKLEAPAKDGIDSGLLQADINQRKEAIDRVSQRIHALRIEVQSPPRIRQLQQATPPSRREIRKQIMMSAFAAIASFGLVAGLCLVYESRRNRVFAANDPAFQGTVPVVGTIPAVAWSKANGSKRQVLYEQFSEAVDRVRAMIFPGGASLPGRVVMITSPEPREGKTILTSHLALSLVKVDRKVLLIDLNLRNPELHRFLDQPDSAGVCEFLRNEATPQEIVRRTSVSGLYLITAGRVDAEARDALGKDRTRRLLEKLRQEFDTILIDAPPVLSSTDAMLIATHADAVLMSALRLVSSHDRIEQARQRLAGVGNTSVGLVLMGEES